MIGKAKRRILISDYDQEIEGWSETKGVYGQPTVKVKIFTVLAKVEELSGSKALQYTEQGINNPVLIETNFLTATPAYLMWNDKKIPVTSMIDPDNHMQKRVIILGSYTQ